MPATPYLGPAYRPRMFAPPVAEPTMMMPPTYGQRPSLVAPPPVQLPDFGGGGGGTFYGSGGGGGGSNGGQRGGVPPWDWGSQDDGPSPEGPDQYATYEPPELDLHLAGDGGMLDRVVNMLGRISKYTPGGMLATLLGKPLAGLAPFKTTPQIMTSAATSGGFSQPGWDVPQGAEPGQDLFGGMTAPNAQQYADPRVMASMLAPPPMGDDDGGDWRSAQSGSFDPSMLATYYDEQNPEGKDWYYDPDTDTYYA